MGQIADQFIVAIELGACAEVSLIHVVLELPNELVPELHVEIEPPQRDRLGYEQVVVPSGLLEVNLEFDALTFCFVEEDFLDYRTGRLEQVEVYEGLVEKKHLIVNSEALITLYFDEQRQRFKVEEEFSNFFVIPQ